MVVSDIQNILDAKIICCHDFINTEIHTACGSDMMSDVLAYVKDQSVLLTGLCNSQVIRTAEMMDIVCIVFVRGKMPDETMISLAVERNIPILVTNHRMFTACGLLYSQGLHGGDTVE